MRPDFKVFFFKKKKKKPCRFVNSAQNPLKNA